MSKGQMSTRRTAATLSPADMKNEITSRCCSIDLNSLKEESNEQKDQTGISSLEPRAKKEKI